MGARGSVYAGSGADLSPALRELHIEFREAGAEVLQALTFYASRDKLATVGLENRLEELNRSAVRVAREVAGDQCLVAGNISLDVDV
jgi:betaine-homocysteine S-methyltransferase